MSNPTPSDQQDQHGSAEIEAIWLSAGHDYWGLKGEGRLQNGIQAVAEGECISGQGLRGDRYSIGRANRKGQVTFLDGAVVDDVRARFRLPKLPSSVFRRNIVVRGLSLETLLGSIFELQGIKFEGAQECKPCHWMDRVIAVGAQAYLSEHFRGGLRAKVLTSGNLRVTSGV